MTALALLVHHRVLPGTRDKAYAAFEQYVATTPFPGRDLAVWAEDGADPDVFVVFEYWSDATAYERHAATVPSIPALQSYLGVVGPLLAEPPTVTRADPRWTTGL